MESKSPFETVEIITKVAVEPSKVNVATFAVKEKLNATLFKYNDDLSGIPISYDNVAYLPGKDYAMAFGESPWLLIEAQVSITLFRPTLGQSVYGRVNKVKPFWLLPCAFLY